MAKELSIFIDESGDFGEYNFHSPYYIVSFVFHDQAKNITNEINKYDKYIEKFNLHNNCIHTSPLIRGEEGYQNMDIHARRKILNTFFSFLKNVKISYKSFYVEKKHLDDEIELTSKLSKQISNFIKDNIDYFSSFETIKIYYDNGQVELTKIIVGIFNTILSDVKFKKAKPHEYKLFQAADLFCYFTLLSLKYESKNISFIEEMFFGKVTLIHRNYLRQIRNYLFK